MNDTYKVLARKYRPDDFSKLKGQSILVQTITNAIKLNRVPHAFLLTGIRGVGKTTTARIIAKTINCTDLNYEDDIIVACKKCQNCLAFSAGKHPDYLEFDAASKTGVNDIREIVENCRYLPQMAKYKIYVIDEVHMLSINAFNALLKTLEEPPSHVIFIFATTEGRKVPVTILSRCQRHDLRRLNQQEIVEHLEYVLEEESYQAEKEALEIIAKCSDGSVRDSLSILDQALLNCKEKNLLAIDILNILGIGDKSEIVDLLEYIVKGDATLAIETLHRLYFKGVEPASLMNELIELINLMNKLKVIGKDTPNNYVLSEQDFKRIFDLTYDLTISYLTTIWQISIKSFANLTNVVSTIGAVEIFLIKLCYISDKKMPIELFEQLSVSPRIEEKIENYTEELPTQNASKLNSFRDLVNLFLQHKEMIIYHHLYEDVNLVKFEQRILKIRQKSNVPHNFANQVSNFLYNWTGIKWVVTLSSSEQGEITLKEQDDAVKELEKNEIMENKIIKEVMSNFEGSKVTNITKISV